MQVGSFAIANYHGDSYESEAYENMDYRDVLPILVPGAIIQVLIQAYYIRHCWQNYRLSRRQKFKYILSIALMSLPGAAVYLFATSNRDKETEGAFEDIEVDDNIRQGIFVILILAFEIFSLGGITENINTPHYHTIIALLGACFMVMIIHGLLVKRQHSLLYYLLPGVQLGLALLIDYFDTSGIGQFIVLVVVAGIINSLSLRPAKGYALGALPLYFASSLLKGSHLYGSMSADETASYTLVRMLLFSLILIAFYTMKTQLISNKRLQSALKRLREQSLQLEEMSAVAERSRITGEIHDTVGHTLTSAVIAIEAGEKTLALDIDAARQKFQLAKDQVKRGLNDLRSSVRTIKTGSVKAFVPQLMELLSAIRSDTGLNITTITELTADLLPIQQYVLLRAVKECATNSIRHGGSTEADLLLQEHRDYVRLTFTDNGVGAETVTHGFGLQSMRESVESIGGTLTVDSARGEGFTVSISIPTGLKGE